MGNHNLYETKITSYSLIGFGVSLAVAAIAGPPVLPTLNPPVAPDYSCSATGDGAICKVDRVFPFNGDGSGFFCGTADQPVELVVYGTDEYFTTRYYNRVGDLTRRVRQETTIQNLVIGLLANVSQNTTFTDTVTVPGDFSSVTTTSGGSANRAAWRRHVTTAGWSSDPRCR